MEGRKGRDVGIEKRGRQGSGREGGKEGGREVVKVGGINTQTHTCSRDSVSSPGRLAALTRGGPLKARSMSLRSPNLCGANVPSRIPRQHTAPSVSECTTPRRQHTASTMSECTTPHYKTTHCSNYERARHLSDHNTSVAVGRSSPSREESASMSERSQRRNITRSSPTVPPENE